VKGLPRYAEEAGCIVQVQQPGGEPDVVHAYPLPIILPGLDH